VGKGSICQWLLEHDPSLRLSVSATTRKPRGEEVHGREYFFYSDEVFGEMLRQGAFLEWAHVFGHYYGTPKAWVEDILNAGQDCILEIDVQGALQVKGSCPEAVLIFIAPPSRESLMERIRKRGTEDTEEIQRRLSQADAEIERRHEYQYVVVNDELVRSAREVQAIIVSRRGLPFAAGCDNMARPEKMSETDRRKIR
jgi:guanylate kinase